MKNKGFTLIELLIVIVVIFILASIAINYKTKGTNYSSNYRSSSSNQVTIREVIPESIKQQVQDLERQLKLKEKVCSQLEAKLNTNNTPADESVSSSEVESNYPKTTVFNQNTQTATLKRDYSGTLFACVEGTCYEVK